MPGVSETAARAQCERIRALAAYLTLHTGRPPSAGNELSGDGYARQAVSAASMAVVVSNGRVRVQTNAAHAWDAGSADWDLTRGCVALWDGLPGVGNWLFFVDVNEVIRSGASATISPGQFACEIDV